MIRMSVGPVGAEGHDHVRTRTPQVHDDVGDRRTWVGAVETLIAVPEQRHVMDAQHRRGGSQFRLPDPGER